MKSIEVLKAIVEQNKYVLIEHPDLVKLLNIIQSMPTRVILEIGTRQGFSFRSFIEVCDPELAITVDILKKEEMPAHEIIPIINAPNVHYLWEHDSRDNSTLTEIQGLLNGRQVDFLFIDGDHMEDTVRSDFFMYSGLVKKGGLIAIHDVIGERDDIHVAPFWNEIIEKYPNQLIKETLQSTGIGLLFT